MLALFGSILWFWIVFSALMITFFISEQIKNGTVAFVAVCIFLGIWAYSGIDPTVYSYLNWPNIILYLFTGFVFSVIRTYVYVKKKWRPFISSPEMSAEAIKRNNRIARDEVKEEVKRNVFRWWFMFPISALHWAFADLLVDLWNFVTRIYDHIVDLAIGKEKL